METGLFQRAVLANHLNSWLWLHVWYGLCGYGMVTHVASYSIFVSFYARKPWSCNLNLQLIKTWNGSSCWPLGHGLVTAGAMVCGIHWIEWNVQSSFTVTVIHIWDCRPMAICQDQTGEKGETKEKYSCASWLNRWGFYLLVNNDENSLRVGKAACAYGPSWSMCYHPELLATLIFWPWCIWRKSISKFKFPSIVQPATNGMSCIMFQRCYAWHRWCLLRISVSSCPFHIVSIESNSHF